MRDKARLKHESTLKLAKNKTVSPREVSLFAADLKIAEAGVAREQGKLAEIDAQINPDDPVIPRPNLAILQARRDAQAAEVARVEAERDRARVVTGNITHLFNLKDQAIPQMEVQQEEFKLAAAEATVVREQARLAEADALLGAGEDVPNDREG